VVGVGLHRYLKGSEPDVKVRLERNLRIQLEDMAGYKIASLINTGDVADMLQNLKLEIK
jgi:hypothetical protein